MSRFRARVDSNKIYSAGIGLANRQDVDKRVKTVLGRIQGSTAEVDMSQSPGSRDLVDSGVIDGPGPNHDSTPLSRVELQRKATKRAKETKKRRRLEPGTSGTRQNSFAPKGSP